MNSEELQKIREEHRKLYYELEAQRSKPAARAGLGQIKKALRAGQTVVVGECAFRLER